MMFLSSGLCGPKPGISKDPPFSLSPAMTIDAVGRAKTNSTAFVQGNVATDPIARGGLITRYTAFYDRTPELSRVWVAKQSRPENDQSGWGAVTVFQGTTGLNGNVSTDAHFGISVGVDKLGVVHIAWRAHGSEGACLYWRGSSAGDINLDTNGVDSGPPFMFVSDISYPKFFNRWDGELFFSGRIGTAGNDAQQVLWWFNTATDTWVEVSDNVIDWPAGVGEEQSPYMFSIVSDRDAQGWTRFGWTWARVNETWSYHDVYEIEGRPLAGNNAVWEWRDPERVACSLPGNNDTRFRVWQIDEDHGLAVHQSIAIDENGWPMFGLWYAPAGLENTPTNFYVISRRGGVFVEDFVGQGSVTWNLVNAPPNSEYLQIRQCKLLTDGEWTWYVYTSNFEATAGTSNQTNLVPALRCRWRRQDDPTTWYGPITLIQMPFGDNTPQFDMQGWDNFGRESEDRVATFYVQFLDDIASWTGPAGTAVYFGDVPLPRYIP